MRILALEPFYGGSHQAFLDSWIERSRHDWTLITLPATKWKWRMRHSAITMAAEVKARMDDGERWDLAIATDMLNLAEFKGLVGADVARLPYVIYMHENQFTYPVRHESERDYHFAMTNLTSCLAADQVWFNSAYHRDDFLGAAERFLKRMPDHHLPGAVDSIRSKSDVHPPGIEPFPARGERLPGPLRILWSARWEHDKGPSTLLKAMTRLLDHGCDFRLSVLGQEFEESPPEFAGLRRGLGDKIDHWGFVEARDEYRQILTQADVVISTAEHEFFGIAIVEAIAAGAYPLLPKRLSYPEVVNDSAGIRRDQYFYDGSSEVLAEKLRLLCERLAAGSIWEGGTNRLVRLMRRYHLGTLVPIRDDRLEVLTNGD